MNQREFYRKVFALVIPMALQNLINVGVTATDVVMLGKVGETVLSGCSLGGQVLFVLNLFLFGTSSGASVLMAQYWGKQDKTAIEKILGIALKPVMLICLIFMVVTLVFPEPIMHLFSSEEAVITEGAKYLKIVALTYPLVGFTSVYLNAMRSVERVIISTIVYGSSLVINFCLNAVLIFGLLGFPAMGIQGAAIATLIARVVEVIIVLCYACFKNHDIKLRLSYFVHADVVLKKDFLYYAIPVILNECIWGLGYSANAAIVGHLGSSATAANSVAHVMRQLSMVIAFGVGNATAIMMGKAIGEGKEEEAVHYSRRFIKLTIICGVSGGLLIFILTPFMTGWLGYTGVTAYYMRLFLYMMSYYAIGQAINTTLVVGVFRAGGDTKFGLILDCTTMWIGSIMIGAIAAFAFHAPVPVVYFILLLDEFIKLPICYVRYRQKKWLKNVTR